jgi:hypothetical protein
VRTNPRRREFFRCCSSAGALDELAYRRRGLFVSLALILIVVTALGLKIRDLGRG